MTVAGQGWLLLLQQIPTKPAYFRVKIRRRLSSIGAVPVKMRYALFQRASSTGRISSGF